MKKTTALLFTGMIVVVIWLTLCLTNPWAGYIMSLACFLLLAGFIIFTLIGYVLMKRTNKRTQNL